MSKLVFRRGNKGSWYSVRTRRSTGTDDKARAEAFVAQEIRADWDRNRLGIVPEKTWDEACLSWSREIGEHLRSCSNQAYIAKVMTQHLSGLRLSQITKDLMHNIMQPRTTKEPSSQNNTANQYACFVAKIIRHGGGVPQKFVRYPTKGGKDRWLTVGEWRTLSSVMKDDLRHIATFALATGLREANVYGVRWEWVKGDTLIIPKEFTKTKANYGIPLNQTAQRVLEERKKERVKSLEYAFLRSNGACWYKGAVVREFAAAVEASGIDKATFHTLRHTFASWLTQGGVEWANVQRLGCWKIKGMGGTYAHMAVEHLREFSLLIDDVLEPKQERRVM